MKTCPVCDTDFPDQHATCPTDGAVLIESQELAPGHLVRGKYRIVRKLGRGGMGVVYLADDTLLGVGVALKFLVGDLGKDPKFIKRFRMEARAAYQLRHPNIVEVTNLDQAEDGSLFIAMEFIDGPSLRSAIEKARAGMDVPRALNIFRGIASGLAAAHAQGTVHRDVKPENILLARAADGREQAKVLDFGIVAIAESVTRQNETHGLLLTPDYAAPEQWTETPAGEMDGRTDNYALGCVLYEMLTGRTPFHAHKTAGWMKQHLEEAPNPPSHLRPELASWKGLDGLVLRLLAKNHNYRPYDAELFRLLDAVQLAPLQPRPQTIVEDAGKRRETIAEDEKPRPAPAAPRAAAPPPAKDVAKPKPEAGKYPGWVWGALAILALVAAFAAWRLLMPQSPSATTPATATGVEPAPQPAPAPKPMDAQASIAEESQPASATDSQAAARKPGASTVEQQAVALYAQKLYAQAGPLLNQACAGGGWEACRNLGKMYHDGLGVAKDDARAAALFEKACDAGYAPACDSLGISYQNGQGVSRDISRAATLYAKACDAGVAKGCNNLGVLYATGNGVAKDDSRAAALYSKACDAGEAMSCSNLGNIYASGRGVQKNDARAVQLYGKACADGDGAGCSNLGNRYRLGLGVDKDPGKARQLLGKGCALGNQWGCDRLKEMQ
ncbi:MAG: serine/threonine-protein kinase [Terracidiphilus sp.]|jgi:TPR repeat protein